MAIARVGAGAGAGTETNGAALNLVCPATVNANDILIAHVMHTGSTTNPTTPSGWTLLYPNPSDITVGASIGTTPDARAWVFGKLATGSEDGATVGFGTGGGTNGRAGRIYSFSGFVSGTLADVVPFASFTDSPTNNDPPGPSVTTTVAGALAIALMAQDDNNTHTGITGESGGTWGDYLEFVSSALGPQGLAMAFNSCTPTADPGTVSGGTLAGVNDGSGTIGFEIRPNAPVAAVEESAADGVDGSDAAHYIVAFELPAEQGLATDAAAATVVPAGGIEEAAIDAGVASDAASVHVVGQSTAVDAAVAGEATASRMDQRSTVADGVEASDSATAPMGVAVGTDGADAADAATSRMDSQALVADGVVSSDTASTVRTVATTAGDQGVTADAATAAVNPAPPVTETASDGVAASDALSASRVFGLPGEVGTASDAATGRVVHRPPATDGVLASSDASSPGMASENAADAVVASEAASARVVRYASATDGAGATDSATPRLVLRQLALEVVLSADTADGRLHMLVFSADGVTVSDGVPLANLPDRWLRQTQSGSQAAAVVSRAIGKQEITRGVL